MDGICEHRVCGRCGCVGWVRAAADGPVDTIRGVGGGFNGVCLKQAGDVVAGPRSFHR